MRLPWITFPQESIPVVRQSTTLAAGLGFHEIPADLRETPPGFDVRKSDVEMLLPRAGSFVTYKWLVDQQLYRTGVVYGFDEGKNNKNKNKNKKSKGANDCLVRLYYGHQDGKHWHNNLRFECSRYMFQNDHFRIRDDLEVGRWEKDSHTSSSTSTNGRHQLPLCGLLLTRFFSTTTN